MQSVCKTVTSVISGDAGLPAYILQEETGQDIDAYAPLGIKEHWKRDYVGTVDTEGGRYLTREGLAKIGFLYLSGAAWEGPIPVAEIWVHQSGAPRALPPMKLAHSLPPAAVAGTAVF